MPTASDRPTPNPGPSDEALTRSGPKLSLVKFSSLMNSNSMLVIDWVSAVVCIAVGLYLVGRGGEAMLTDWAWLLGGCVSMVFAVCRPVQKLTNNLTGTIRRNPTPPTSNQ